MVIDVGTQSVRNGEDGGRDDESSPPSEDRSANGGLGLEWTLFRTLWLEEWRLHTSLFGGWRFYGFPLVIAGLVVAGGYALTATGYSSDAILLGVHVTALAFGLYSGTAAFAGSDMLENVFGDLSLLLGSSNSLPLSRRRLLGHFLVKDTLFYAITIVAPLALVVVPLEGLGVATLSTVVRTWLSMTLLFAAGMAITVGLIALRTRGLPLRGVGWVGILAIVGWLAVGRLERGGVVDPGRAEPFETTGGPGIDAVVLTTAAPTTWLAVLLGTVGLGALSLRVYDPSYTTPARSSEGRVPFARYRALPGTNPLVAKTLVDLVRSSGGLFKPVVSIAILLGVVAFLVTVVREITTIEPALGVFYGSVLGLSAFTTYNWLTQFDAVESYGAYPVTVEAVFRAKQLAFFLVGLPTMAGAYLLVMAWLGPPVLDAVTGFVLRVGLALYYYGLTVYVAGVDPNEFRFDAVRGVGFTVGVACLLLPTLVVGFVVVPLTATVAAALLATGLVAGLLGHLLARRAARRWADRYRRGQA